MFEFVIVYINLEVYKIHLYHFLNQVKGHLSLLNSYKFHQDFFVYIFINFFKKIVKIIVNFFDNYKKNF